MNIAMPRRVVPFLIGLLLLLSACGFHLRGYHKPTKVAQVSVYIQTDDNSDIAQSVRSQLKAGEARVMKEAESAEYILHLGRQKLTRRVLSVSARTGKAEEYQLILTIAMAVSKPDGEIVMEKQTVSVSRDYTFSQDQALLGQSSEEDTLRRELVDQAAREVLSRLNAVTQQSDS
ncbi:MAG: LPS assembly lipoprotein LptE [Gammaproteobacteria bacterium]